VSLDVAAGEVRLLVGPNGSGKSTLARLAAGLLKPTRGSVQVAGRDPRRDAGARRAIGFVGHQSLLYDDLTPRENLRFTARLYGLPAAAVERALDRLAVEGERALAVRRLSRGMVQRVALARALLPSPRLLILDEPFTGLDAPSAARLAGILVEERAAGAAVLVASHVLEDAWPIATAVMVLLLGRLAFAAAGGGPLDEFRRRYAEAIGG
jgi:heme exporter protein A